MQIAKPVDERASVALLTATDVADRLKMAKTGVYALFARGDLAHLRIGRLVRVREDDLSAYLASCRWGARENQSASAREDQPRSVTSSGIVSVWIFFEPGCESHGCASGSSGAVLRVLDLLRSGMTGRLGEDRGELLAAGDIGE